MSNSEELVKTIPELSDELSRSLSLSWEDSQKSDRPGFIAPHDDRSETFDAETIPSATKTVQQPRPKSILKSSLKTPPIAPSDTFSQQSGRKQDGSTIDERCIDSAADKSAKSLASSEIKSTQRSQMQASLAKTASTQSSSKKTPSQQQQDKERNAEIDRKIGCCVWLSMVLLIITAIFVATTLILFSFVFKQPALKTKRCFQVLPEVAQFEPSTTTTSAESTTTLTDIFSTSANTTINGNTTQESNRRKREAGIKNQRAKSRLRQKEGAIPLNKEATTTHINTSDQDNTTIKRSESRSPLGHKVRCIERFDTADDKHIAL